MSDDDLLEKGYIKFKPSKFDSDNVEVLFQKRFDDDIGKKYFITVKKWKAWKHPYTLETFPSVYEYNIQMYKKGNRDLALDLLFHSSWNLIDVEKYTDELWNTGLFEYYELFN